jgi:type VI secretion system ImpC/EvpB family protein
MEFEFELGSPRKGRPRDDSTPMRLLVLGDFSGRPAAERPPLATRPTHKVDVDTLGAVIQRIGPRLRMAAEEIALSSIDDFHPDALFRRAAVFEALRRTRTNPPSSSVEVAEDLGRLLGKPAEAAAAPVAPAGSVEAMIQNIVAPHIVKGAAADTKSYLATVDASITAEMRTVLHDPSFQSLESVWRGVQWLTANLELDGPLQLHLFDVAREELIADIVAAQGTLSQTGLYRALVDRWRNVPGSEGWSVLAAMIEFDSSSADLGLLAAMGVIASNAGAPLLAGADLSFVNADEASLADWNVLRRSKVAPWIGLAAPRVLLRNPYGKASDPIDAFAFEEIAGEPAPNELLWGSGALAATLLLGRSFSERGWDMEPGDEREIADLPAYTFTRDGERELQPCAEQILTESQIDRMIKAGLMPIAAHRNRNAVTAVRFQSIADPPAALAWC